MLIHLHIVNSCRHAMVMEFSLYPENPGVYTCSLILCRKALKIPFLICNISSESIMVVLVKQDDKNKLRTSCATQEVRDPYIVHKNI